MIGIPSSQVDDYWPIAAPLIRKVTDKFDTGYTAEDLKEECKSQAMQLWLIDNRAVFVSQIQIYPQYKVLHLQIIAGTGMADWLDKGLSVLEEFAKHNGCKYISGCGRKGWVREGQSRGYREAIVTTRKELI